MLTDKIPNPKIKFSDAADEDGIEAGLLAAIIVVCLALLFVVWILIALCCCKDHVKDMNNQNWFKRVACCHCCRPTRKDPDASFEEVDRNFAERFFYAFQDVENPDAAPPNSDSPHIGNIPIEFNYKDKKEVRDLSLNLTNVCLITHEAIKALAAMKQKETIVAVGDTGCGKSTLLTALIYGVDALKEEKVGKKMVISAKAERDDFRIGHSATES